MLYGVAREGNPQLAVRVHDLIASAGPILAFDEAAARQYGRLRADLERRGRPLAEPDLRIAAIVLSIGATLFTANVRHLARVPELHVENWLVEDS